MAKAIVLVKVKGSPFAVVGNESRFMLMGPRRPGKARRPMTWSNYALSFEDNVRALRFDAETEDSLLRGLGRLPSTPERAYQQVCERGPIVEKLEAGEGPVHDPATCPCEMCGEMREAERERKAASRRKAAETRRARRP